MTGAIKQQPLPCKVVLIRWHDEQVQFGLVGDGHTDFPEMPFPDLLEIDRELMKFAKNSFGMTRPLVHGQFVERPHPEGPLYYMVEEQEPAGPPHSGIRWLGARAAASHLSPEERRGLARAMGYLSGQRFGQGIGRGADLPPRGER